MKQVFFSLIAFFFCALKCYKEGDDCHIRYSIQNKSSQSVIYAMKIGSAGTDLCKLDGSLGILGVGETKTKQLSYCMEGEFSGGRTYDIWIVDPAFFNPPLVYYQCDSIEMRNKVLKKFELTLQDMKDANWTIVYE
jgi:hypothetical protein